MPKLTHAQWVAKYCPDEPNIRGIVMMAAPATAPPADPDAAFKAEYQQDRSTFMRSGISESDYCASRRATEQHHGQVSMLDDDKQEPALYEDEGELELQEGEPADYAVGSKVF